MHRVGVRIASLALLAAVVTTGVGCGKSPAGSVAGTVLLDGEPLTEGTVAFYDMEKGKGLSCLLDETGMFVSPVEVPPGRYKVMIAPGGGPGAHQAGADGMPALPGYDGPRSHRIPMKFRDYEKSGLTADVGPGENSFHFELEST